MPFDKTWPSRIVQRIQRVDLQENLTCALKPGKNVSG